MSEMLNALDQWSFVALARHRLREELDSCDVLATELLLSINRASNLITYDLEASVHRPEDRSWAAFRMMYVLWLTGPLESKKLAELTGMSRAAVSNLTGPLVDQEILVKETHPEDGRSVLLRLTETGERVTRDAYRRQNERERSWTNVLSEDEQHELVRLLAKLADARSDFEHFQRT